MVRTLRETHRAEEVGPERERLLSHVREYGSPVQGVVGVSGPERWGET